MIDCREKEILVILYEQAWDQGGGRLQVQEFLSITYPLARFIIP